MNKKGFTLIEVLLAITIVGVLSGFVVVQMNNAANASKDAKRKADIELIKNALVSYRSENYSATPAEDCDIGECTSLPTALGAFLATLPNDPNSGSSYRYVSDGVDCSVYATLSNGSIYRYECSNNQVATVFPTDGVCGADDDAVLNSTPTALCNTGAPSAITGAGPWFWSCAGENEGDDATCWARLSDVFTCSISSTCTGGVDVFHIYAAEGGHAELNTQTVYGNKVCCSGAGAVITNITNTDSCPVNAATILKLYSAANSHVEKGSESNYTNKICLSATGKTATCVYASSCATGFTELASISDGETSLHVGGGVFGTKICCKLQSY